MKKSLTFTAVVIGALLGASALSVLAQSSGWISPTATPPGNNVAAPINVGAITQEKTGSLLLDGNLGALGQSILMGNVGVGTANPLSPLSVTGQSAAANGDGVTGIAQFTTGTGLNTDNKLQIGIVDNDYAWIEAIRPSSTNGKYLNLVLNPNSSNSNVGINNINPTATLDVNGTVKLEGAGTPGAGKVLTSDAYGNATWQEPTLPPDPICAKGETQIPGGSAESYITAKSSYCGCFMKSTATTSSSWDLGYGEVNGNCGTNYVDSQDGCDGNGCGLTTCASRSTYHTWGYGMREIRYTNGLPTCYKDWP